MKLNQKYTDIEKRNFVQSFIASGDSLNCWCKSMRLPHSTFYGWVKKYKSDTESSDFVEIIAPASKQVQARGNATPIQKESSTLFLEYHDFKIGIDADLNLELLANVLRVVTSFDV